MAYNLALVIDTQQSQTRWVSTCSGWPAALQEADSWTTGQSPRCQTARTPPSPLRCILWSERKKICQKIMIINLNIYGWLPWTRWRPYTFVITLSPGEKHGRHVFPSGPRCCIHQTVSNLRSLFHYLKCHWESLGCSEFPLWRTLSNQSCEHFLWRAAA